MHIYFYILMTGEESTAVWAVFVPEGIHNPVAILVSGLSTGHICYVRLFLHHNIFCIYILLVQCKFCHFYNLLTETGVMHEAGYIYSIWSTS